MAACLIELAISTFRTTELLCPVNFVFDKGLGVNALTALKVNADTKTIEIIEVFFI